MDELNIEKYYEPIKQAQAENNAWSAAQAQKAMDYQTYMSNTAHQREVADLKAAGLNPVLSAGGTGATTSSGVAASAGQENITAMYGLMSKALQATIDQSQAMQNTAKYIASASSGNGTNNTPVSSSGFEEGSIGDGVLSVLKDIAKRKLGISPDTIDKLVEGVQSGTYQGEANQITGAVIRNALKNNTRSSKDMIEDPSGYKSDPWFVKLLQKLNPNNNKSNNKDMLASISSAAKKIGSSFKGNGRSGKFNKNSLK